MAGHRISGAINSVITSTGGRSVVPDTSSREPISFVCLISTCVPVMFDSSHVPNIFPDPVMRENPLNPTYDRNLPMHPNEMFDHHRHGNAPAVTTPPFSLFQYLERYTTYFDVARFAGCRLLGLICKCGTFSTSIVTWLLLGGLNVEIVSPVSVLLFVALLSKRQICHSWAVQMKWTTSADWSRFWR